MHALSYLDALLPFGLLTSGYFSYKCQTRPVPLAKGVTARDTLSRLGIMRFWAFYRLYILCFASMHTLLAGFCWPHQQLTLCPAWDQVNQKLFTWNWYTATLMVLIIVSGKARLAAYSQLGSNFTYNLSTPNHLVTTGIYSYVRHPSYSAHAVNNIAMTLLFMRPDGIVACFFSGIPYLGAVHFTLNLILVPTFASIRVPEEEDHLRETFKDKWDAYSAQTKKFIPWLL